jgi:hypothetical protein
MTAVQMKLAIEPGSSFNFASETMPEVPQFAPFRRREVWQQFWGLTTVFDNNAGGCPWLRRHAEDDSANITYIRMCPLTIPVWVGAVNQGGHADRVGTVYCPETLADGPT